MASGENYSSALASAKTNSIGATKLIDNELYGTWNLNPEYTKMDDCIAIGGPY